MRLKLCFFAILFILFGSSFISANNKVGLDFSCNTQTKHSLHVAIMEENFQLAHCLLENGANPNDTGNKGNVPIFHAVYQGNEYMELLFNYGADANAMEGKPLSVSVRRFDMAIRDLASAIPSNKKKKAMEAIKQVEDAVTKILILLKNGADFNIYPKNIVVSGTEITSLFNLVEGSCTANISKEFDYNKTLTHIYKASRFPIKFSKSDTINIERLQLLAPIGLYSLECLLFNNKLLN